MVTAEPGVGSMQRPLTAVSGRHLPALDGLRGLAILSVMAYHLGFGWASGGYLGVDLFFVLSGFLITSLLLEEWCSTGRIRLGSFWGRRARRLLPALFLVVIVVMVYTVVNGRISVTGSGAASALTTLRGDGLATLFYVANWHMIFFNQTVSPFTPTWSLAIEEQFYLLWPLVIVLLVKSSSKRWRRVGFGLCLVGALASAAEMAALVHANNSGYVRVYNGTDTRAFDLLAGAAVAMLVAARPQPGRRGRSVLHIAATVAAGGLVVLWVTAAHTNWMTRGGFLTFAVLAAVVVADGRQFEPGRLGRLLSVRPLCWIGTISYGLYLWHWPVNAYLDPTRSGISGAGLDLARVVLTFVLAIGSYYLVELPIRRRRFPGRSGDVVIPGAAILAVLLVLVGTTPSVAAPVRVWRGGGLYPGAGPTVPGAGGFGDEARLGLPSGLVLSPTHPLRVLAIGDSVMTFAELGITAALQSTGEVSVTPETQSTWGLTTSGGQALVQRKVRQLHPQLVIGTWSTDNATALSDPRAYRSVLASAIEALLTPGDGVLGVVFLQMPVFGPVPSTIASSPLSRAWHRRAAGVAAWNDAVQRSAEAFPGRVMYLPVGGSLELDGRYTNWLPPHDGAASAPKHWVRVRTSDGVHLCPPGITRYAAPVLEDLTELFELAPSRTHWWESYGVTVRAFSYQNASLSLTCPDDHPPG